MAMTDNMIAGYIAQNLRQLRQSRNLTQEQLARLSGVPRPTWSNLESGAANPTVAVLAKVAAALQVPVEELISPPKAQAKLYRADSIPRKLRGGPGGTGGCRGQICTISGRRGRVSRRSETLLREQGRESGGRLQRRGFGAWPDRLGLRIADCGLRIADLFSMEGVRPRF